MPDLLPRVLAGTRVAGGEIADRGETTPLLREPDLDQLSAVVRQTRDLIQYIDTARDSVLLVRRARAVEMLVDEALKNCHLLEEQQFELRQEAAEAHLRTQRRAGELLTELLLHPGGRPRKTSSSEGAVTQPPTLRELGIDRHESHRWQRIAMVPRDLFEEHISRCRTERKELTTNRMLLLANRAREATSDGIDGEARPSAGPALLVEYRRAMRHLSELLWLDPLPLARAMGLRQREEEIECLKRLRLWLDEFEQALGGAGSLL
ncbi:MAG TPA: hypothetical protein VLW53_20950 [Candidatus Eisenbacteria bacterium]|nr:hypothetical protein [Candidatus Eisenbacteria bacterium]